MGFSGGPSNPRATARPLHRRPANIGECRAAHAGLAPNAGGVRPIHRGVRSSVNEQLRSRQVRVNSADSDRRTVRLPDADQASVEPDISRLGIANKQAWSGDTENIGDPCYVGPVLLPFKIKRFWLF